MTTTEGIKVAPKQTEHQKCNSCLYGNPFDIEVKQQDAVWYYMTKCPRCNHYDEVKTIPYRKAQDFIAPAEKN